MSDLISRSEVLDILQREKNLNCGYDADIAIFSIEKQVRELSIAYDVEKVIEQVKQERSWRDGGTRRVLGYAIKYIREGGVNENNN